MEQLLQKFVQDGDTPLHKAADYNSTAVAIVLLDRHAKANAANKDGKYPYEHAQGELRRKLRAAWAIDHYKALLAEGKVRPGEVKICIIGPPEAGKTTLVLVLSDVREATEGQERTAGIEVITVDIPEAGGRLIFYDTAGQEVFHQTHAIVFGGVCTMFALVLDGSLDEAQLEEEMRYFLSLVRSGRAPDEPPPHVLTVVSHEDKMSPVKKVRVQKRIAAVQLQFQAHFTFDDKPIFADCRQKNSPAMKDIKVRIAAMKKKCIESAPEVPLICHKMRVEILPELRTKQRERNSGQFTSKKKFKSRMKSKMSSALVSTVFKVLVEYLNESGEIIEMTDRLLIDIEWLCRYIVGPILSSEAFPISLSTKMDGTVSFAQIAEVLELYSSAYGTPTVKPKSAVKILTFLGLCQALKSKPGFYQFPSKIQIAMPAQAWQKEQRMQVFSGWRICCESDLEIINPSAFTALQSVIAQMRGLNATTWKAGIQISKEDEEQHSGVEILVSLEDETRMVQGIDIIARGPTNSERNCKMFLAEIYHVAMKIIDKKSPGTSVVRRYLSRKQISNHFKRPMSYTEEQVSTARKENGIVSVSSDTASISETLVDLLAVEDDHVMFLSNSTRKTICGLLDQAFTGEACDWRMIGELLHIPSHILESFRMSEPGAGLASSGSTEKMLSYYSESTNATISKLLDVLKQVDRADVIEVLEKDIQSMAENRLRRDRSKEAVALAPGDEDDDDDDDDLSESSDSSDNDDDDNLS